MYIPKKYRLEDDEQIFEFIRNNSFGILVSVSNQKIQGTHLPMQILRKDNRQLFLQGHIARANPQWRAFESEAELMVIFNGPHSYVSSSWYDFEEVPTWNYIAAHVYGNARILNESELMTHLKSLTDLCEKTSRKPVKIENLSSETMKQAKAIVGFEIKINDIQAVQKLSQGHSVKNQSNIITELLNKNAPNSTNIANEMKKNKTDD